MSAYAWLSVSVFRCDGVRYTVSGVSVRKRHCNRFYPWETLSPCQWTLHTYLTLPSCIVVDDKLVDWFQYESSGMWQQGAWIREWHWLGDVYRHAQSIPYDQHSAWSIDTHRRNKISLTLRIRWTWKGLRNATLGITSLEQVWGSSWAGGIIMARVYIRTERTSLHQSAHLIRSRGLAVWYSLRELSNDNLKTLSLCCEWSRVRFPARPFFCTPGECQIDVVSKREEYGEALGFFGGYKVFQALQPHTKAHTMSFAFLLSHTTSTANKQGPNQVCWLSHIFRKISNPGLPRFSHPSHVPSGCASPQKQPAHVPSSLIRGFSKSRHKKILVFRAYIITQQKTKKNLWTALLRNSRRRGSNPRPWGLEYRKMIRATRSTDWATPAGLNDLVHDVNWLLTDERQKD
jgi:hypothetical protein